MQLARAISGDDIREMICGPVASTNDSRSIGERGSLEHHQGEKGRLRAGMKTSETLLPVRSLSATFDRSSHNAVTISATKLSVLSLQFSYVALMLTRVKWCCVEVRAVQCVGKLFQWASQMQRSILTLTSVWQRINKTHTFKGHLGLI